MRRKVFYIPGFDPRGVKHYYGLFQEHVQKQSRLNGLDIEIGPRQKNAGGSFGWDLTANGGDARTDYEFLAWDDVVRKNWPKSWLSLLGAYATVFLHYIFLNAAINILKISFKKSAILVAFCLSPLLILGLLSYVFSVATGVEFILSLLLVSLVLVGPVFYLLEKANFYWVIRIINFLIRFSEDNDQVMGEKIDMFSQKIVEALSTDDYDEVLVVGHSVGAVLAIPVMAEVERLATAQNISTQKLSLLTLGACIPPMSILSKSGWFRENLLALGKRSFFWVDISSAIDAVCFWKVDPVKMHAEAHLKPTLKSPVMVSAKFFKIFEAKRYKKLKYDWFNIHFLYILSSDFLGENDYYTITCGRASLKDLYDTPQEMKGAL